MTLNGIDVSAWQAGINLKAVPADFVIVKATEGLSYTSPVFRTQIDAAAAADRLIGAYHYANGANATMEADRFIAAFSPYAGHAIPVLDWESGGNAAWGNGSWIRTWVTRVHDRIKVWPLVYVQASAIGQVPADVRAHCGLWVAQYASYATTGYQAHPWNEGAYSCAMRQYSSTGRLAGYGDNLDLNIFYGDKTAWNRYATGDRTTKPTTTGGNIMTKTSADQLLDLTRPRFIGARDTDSRYLWIPGQKIIPLYEPKEMQEMSEDYKNITGLTIPTVLYRTAKQMRYAISIINDEPAETRKKLKP